MIHLRPYQANTIARGQIFPGWPIHEADAAAMYPQFRWFWCQKGSDGWTITERKS